MTDEIVQQKLKDKVETSTVVTPGPLSINWRDVGRGALFAVGTAIIPLVQQALSTGAFNWKIIGTTAASTLLTYITVKFFSPTQQITTFK